MDSGVTFVWDALQFAVVNHTAVNRVSYNGGPGGTTAFPTAQERATAAEPHMSATPRQHQIVQRSAGNPELMARAFVDHPVIAARIKPAVVSAPGAARTYNTAAAAVSVENNRAHVRPIATLHSHSVAEHSAAPVAVAHSQVSSARPAAEKRTAATPARPQHPRP